jgi:membrane-bound metal-dependent hydrolase YbcI (DUF457 family)
MGTTPYEGRSTGAGDQQQVPQRPADQDIPAQRLSQAARPGSQPAASEHGGLVHSLARSPFAGFIPWILYWVIGGPSTWETAAIAALLAAVLLTVLSIERQPAAAGPGRAGPTSGRPAGSRLDLRRLKVLDAATVVFFAALVIVALVTNRHDLATLDKYSQALSSGALGLIALGSILVGHPFTVDYAKEQAPPEVWHTAAFKKINLVLTTVWAVVFLLCAGLGLLSVHVHTKGLQDWLNWYIPIALIIVGVRLNSWYPNRVRSQTVRMAVPQPRRARP